MASVKEKLTFSVIPEAVYQDGFWYPQVGFFQDDQRMYVKRYDYPYAEKIWALSCASGIASLEAAWLKRSIDEELTRIKDRLSRP